MKFCLHCDHSFSPSRSGQIYCSKECQLAASKSKKLERGLKIPPMPYNQALANAWLMDRGLEDIPDIFNRDISHEIQKENKEQPEQRDASQKS